MIVTKIVYQSLFYSKYSTFQILRELLRLCKKKSNSNKHYQKKLVLICNQLVIYLLQKKKYSYMKIKNLKQKFYKIFLSKLFIISHSSYLHEF